MPEPRERDLHRGDPGLLSVDHGLCTAHELGIVRLLQKRVGHVHGTDGGAVAMTDGRDQSRITGVVAAETAIALLRGDVPVGVRGMADILSLRELKIALGRVGCRITGVREQERL